MGHLYSRILLFFLLIIGAVFRVVPLYNGAFSYMYDNAKDQLEIMEMGIGYKPALSGAVTSIPGVFNGPFWYYLALPANLLGQFHPFASVITVVIMGLLSIIGIYRAAGWFEAVLYTTSLGLVGAQQSAWTPYMTPFIVLPVLLILLSVKKNAQLGIWKLRLLIFLTSLSFHFQTAFGVVLLPLVIIILIMLKQIRKKYLVDLLIAFCLPFLPFIAFEIRHGFHQTRQISNFIIDFQERAALVQPNAPGLYRLTEIGNYMLKSAVSGVSPIETTTLLTTILGFGILGFCLHYLLKSKHTYESIVFSVLLIGSYFLYLFLPAKSYYFVALLPVWIILFSKAVRFSFSKIWMVLFSVILICLGTLRMMQNSADYREALENQTFPYAPKLEAVKTVYELSQGKPFVSYHFVPEIYDYTYQQIYLYLINRGYPLPVEFSYAPGEMDYVPQKNVPGYETIPEYTFLIVEKGLNEPLYSSWQQRVVGGLTILEEYPINNALTVYKAEKN
jgi:hypothetical protein